MEGKKNEGQEKVCIGGREGGTEWAGKEVIREEQSEKTREEKRKGRGRMEGKRNTA